MTFSIITATYDKRKRSLLRAMNSVSNQSCKEYERIICFQDYRFIDLGFPSTKNIIVSNCTMVGNKQKREGLKEAGGKYVLFLDDDNLLAKNALSHLQSIITQHEPDIIYSPIYYNNERVLGTEEFRCGGVDLLQWCIKTDFAKKVEFPLEGYASDWEYFSKLAAYKPKIYKSINIIGVHAPPAEYESIDKVPGWFNCAELYTEVAKALPQNPRCAEVGVFMGKSALFLGKLLREKNGRLFAVDKWELDPKPYFCDDNQLLFEQVTSIIKWFGMEKTVIPVHCDSISASKLFDDNSFDFVFIDANHSFESVFEDIRVWYPKVKKGGFLGGDDYHHDWPGVIKAVNDFFPDTFRLIDRGWLVTKQ